jgi:hypothetical protein
MGGADAGVYGGGSSDMMVSGHKTRAWLLARMALRAFYSCTDSNFLLAMRPLILHVSALNDLEYNLFTSSLNDLAVSPDPNTVQDDAHFEAMSVGVREVRAWLRGRYPHDLPTTDIDKVWPFLRLLHVLTVRVPPRS